MDASYDDMALDRWADYYDQARRDGGGEIVEDDSFDMQRILAEAAAREGDDDWAPDETWTPD